MAYETEQNDVAPEATNETEAYDAGTTGAGADGAVEAAEGELTSEQVVLDQEPPAENPFKWYIIHAYSGFERKVKESLESRVRAYRLEDRVGRIEIPTEPTTEMRNGKKYTIDRVFLPGYVFVEMALDNDLWHVVKNTPRVTGFLQTGDQPNALSEQEVSAMLNRADVTKEKPKLKVKFEKGEQVRITEGPFANFNGAVDDINEDKQTLKVMVSIFGRPTPTEVPFASVEKSEE